MSDLDNDSEPVTMEGEASESVKPKKRVSNPDSWILKKSKKARDEGKAYTSYKTKKNVEGKVIGPPCTCSLRCYSVVGMPNIESLFESFWALGSHNAQSAYIMKHIDLVEIKRRYVKKEDVKRKRSYQKEYSVIVNDKKYVVCMVAFLNIHGVSRKRVENVMKKTGPHGTPPMDKRGTNPNSRARKISDEVLKHVHDHIKGLPTCTSHYSRAKSKEEYLPPGSSQRTLYKDYEKFAEDRGLTGAAIVPFWKYKEIFSTYKCFKEPKEDAEPDVIVKTEPIDDYCDRESQLMENIKLESEDADEFLDIKVEPEEDPFANDSTQDLALADLVQTQSTPTTSQLLSCRKTKNVDQEANKYMVFPGNSTCYSSVMLTSDAHTQETFEGGGGGRDDKAAGQKGTMVVVGLVSSENDSKEENSRVLPESHKQATEEVQKGKKKNTWGRKVFKNVDESLVAISSAGYNADEYKVFGEYVAQTLRSMNRPDLFRKVKIEINEILLGAISECLPHIKPKPKSKT